MNTPRTFEQTYVLTEAEAEMLSMPKETREIVTAALARELETQLANAKKEIAMLRETCRTSYPAEDMRAMQAAAEHDKARLDWLKDGVKFMHEQGSCGHPDLWTIYDKDWSQPLGTGATLRDAIDDAIFAARGCPRMAASRNLPQCETQTGPTGRNYP